MQGPNNQTLYTRAGTFSKNASGQLVTQDGYLVVPNITFPSNTVNIQINQTGAVFADPGTGVLTQVGQLTIANFANDAGLQAIGNNLYQETPSAGNGEYPLDVPLYLSYIDFNSLGNGRHGKETRHYKPDLQRR